MRPCMPRPLSFARDRGAALFVVAVDLHALPDAVEVIGVAPRKGVDRGAGGGVDDEDAADRRFAVVGDKRAGGHHLDGVILGAVEMDAMRAIMLGAGRQNVFFIERMNHEQHALILLRRGAAGKDEELRPSLSRSRTTRRRTTGRRARAGPRAWRRCSG